MAMIFLFTDYGLEGPYLGQVQACLTEHAPQQKLINLFVNAPKHNPRACAYLLAAYTNNLPDESVFFCVVDPGVGTFEDKPVILQLDDKCYVGPDNGLFDIVARQAKHIGCREIKWRPESLSNSFHGRDLYAPVCAMLANGEAVSATEIDWQDRHGWPVELAEIIYIDHFGNCMTGLSGENLGDSAIIEINGESVSYAQTFSIVEKGQAFWYRNANGLVEIAVNSGDAAELLTLGIGTGLSILGS